MGLPTQIPNRIQEVTDVQSHSRLTRMKLAQLDRPGVDLAVTAATPQRALAQAEAADKRRAADRSCGPLDGKFIAWKDIIDQVGEVTTLGSALHKNDEPASRNADVVTHLERSGAISLARTNLSEFAFSGLGINPHFGTPASALSEDKPLLPGGSSSGSAVLVAHGIVDIGIGTDTSGSIRIPAALNGIFGYRPSSRRYRRTGVHPLSETLDTVGVLARSPATIVEADRLLTEVSEETVGRDRPDLLDLSDTLGPQWSDEVIRPYLQALERAQYIGWKIRKFRLRAAEEIQSLLQTQGPLVAIEARRRYGHLLTSPSAAHIDPMIRTRLLQAPLLSDADYGRYLRKRADLVSRAKREIGDALIVHPTVTGLRHPLKQISSTSAASSLNAELLCATMIGSLLDLPGLAIPLSGTGGRVESSLLLSAPSGRDQTLLMHGARLADHLSIENTATHGGLNA